MERVSSDELVIENSEFVRLLNRIWPPVSLFAYIIVKTGRGMSVNKEAS